MTSAGMRAGARTVGLDMRTLFLQDRICPAVAIKPLFKTKKPQPQHLCHNWGTVLRTVKGLLTHAQQIHVEDHDSAHLQVNIGAFYILVKRTDFEVGECLVVDDRFYVTEREKELRVI